jgi:hypothetical protein
MEQQLSRARRYDLLSDSSLQFNVSLGSEDSEDSIGDEVPTDVQLGRDVQRKKPELQRRNTQYTDPVPFTQATKSINNQPRESGLLGMNLFQNQL